MEMFNTHKVEIDWGGRKLTLETGRMARQADAAVYAQYGETSLLATVVAAKSVKPGIEFPADRQLPGEIYAAGKIPAAFSAKGARPKETLTRASSIARSARCSSRASNTRHRSSSRC